MAVEDEQKTGSARRTRQARRVSEVRSVVDDLVSPDKQVLMEKEKAARDAANAVVTFKASRATLAQASRKLLDLYEDMTQQTLADKLGISLGDLRTALRQVPKDSPDEGADGTASDGAGSSSDVTADAGGDTADHPDAPAVAQVPDSSDPDEPDQDSGDQTDDPDSQFSY